MNLKDKLISRTAITIYIIFSSIFLLVLVMDTWVLPSLVHSRAEISIPDVSERTLAEAEQVLIDNDLTPRHLGSSPSSDVPPGHVVFQDPPAGNIVREGRNIYLTVSGGEERTTMPNLRGRSMRDAKIALEQNDLRLGLVLYEASDLPAETVIGQSIPPGKNVKKNKQVEITVSGGTDIEVEVPYVIGLSLEEAQQKFLNNGLRLGTITYHESSNLLPNTVIGQDPSAGDKVNPNSPVNITVVH